MKIFNLQLFFFLLCLLFLSPLKMFSQGENNDMSYDDPDKMFVNSSVKINSTALKTVHDSQIMNMEYNNTIYTLIIYCSLNPNKYILNVLDTKNKIIFESDILSDTILGKTLWAPRFFPIDSSTARLIFTLNNTSIYYRDFSLKNFKFNKVKALNVKSLLKDNIYSNYEDLTLSVYIKHIKNTIDIDLNSSQYNSFSGRTILVNGTDQLQFKDSTFFLTLEILSEGFKYGDCGGISCLMESKDLINWKLLKPVFVGENASNFRNHEMSMTYLGSNWYGFSRYNTDSINGYMSWISSDGNNWNKVGLSSFPKSVKGYKHSIFSFSNEKIMNGEKIAVIAYQKFDSLDVIPINDHLAQRKKIGIALTSDFVNYIELLTVYDNSYNTYPSVSVKGDILYMSWSSGKGYFVESIKYSKINLLSLFKPIHLELDGYKTGDIQWEYSADKQNWQKIEDARNTTLLYVAYNNCYFRCKVNNCGEISYSETIRYNLFNP